jgi:mRNA interferase MazF
MRRGEVWTLSGGSGYAGKPRPVVIVQSDRFAETDSATFCPLTTDATVLPLLRLAIEPRPSNGLGRPSQIMIDKIMTVQKSKFGGLIGRLSDLEMVETNRLISVFLGIAD